MLKGELKRQAILNEAEQLFFTQGYAETSLEDILSRLHCTKGSFYHYFDSKQQVLSELCRQHGQNALTVWRGERYGDTLAALNGLLYYALPFRTDGARLLSLLLPLHGQQEGLAMESALLSGLRETLLPELEAMLVRLREEGVAFWHQDRLPELVWDAHAALFERLMTCADRLRSGGAAGDVVAYLEAARFLWERVLDLPFGSMEIVRAEEALAAMHAAIKRVNHLPNEKNAQPSAE